MGCRGQVKILMENPIKEDNTIKKNPKGVYLYTHWNAGLLVENVQNALSKGWRWNDESYLARIIYDQMTLGEPEEQETGYGIDLAEHGDIEVLVTVDCFNQKITVKDDVNGTKLDEAFTEFVKLDLQKVI